MQGGVILFRGSGTDARRYLESDRSRADEYYLEGRIALAEFSVVGGKGAVVGEGVLTPDQYAQWVDWINPITRESMGKPRLPGNGRRGSPRFAEIVVNAPKSLSIAAALHPEVSEALDAAQRDAMGEIRRWLGQHSITRIGPRGNQEVVPVEQLETVSVVHKTSRAGDPHRHIHFQIGARVWAAGAWRGLDTGALFKQQGAIRALGTAVIAAHPRLAAVLDAHGLTLDPVTGEVAELQPYNAVMSKRGKQVARNLARFEEEWRASHPERGPGPVARSRLTAMAWGHERPHKRPAAFGHEDAWRAELHHAGYRPNPQRMIVQPAVSLDDLSLQQVASRALDRCAAAASTWTVHNIQEHATRIITETGVQSDPKALSRFVAITTRLAYEDCLSVLPPGAAQPEHVAHLTSLHVVAVETSLRDMLQARANAGTSRVSDSTHLVAEQALDDGQVQAATAIASADPLVVVEGAAGAGKTKMLGAAIEAAAEHGRWVRVATPTKKAAEVARHELGVPADSVAKLVHEHGWRWNSDGVWTRLAPGDIDPSTGVTYSGPTNAAQLARGERIVVDEAGILDQDTALALLAVADEYGATLALVGDRAQLAAVGRGGVLDMAAQISSRVFGIKTVHRFTDPVYAELTLAMREGRNPSLVFDRLHALGLVVVHNSSEDVHDVIARDASEGDAIIVSTNEEARELNARIREERVRVGLIDDVRTVAGNDGLLFGRGDVIQTRRNDADVQVANRQTWTVKDVGDDGAVWVAENGSGRKHQRTVRLPAEYVAEHTHLAYASTAYGVQGTTVPEAHTVLSDALDASGVYVGMTRGRESNRLHIVATDLDDAREHFTAALERVRADRGLVAATRTASSAVAGLAAGGPVRLVNDERARLVKEIERADAQAGKWKRAAAALEVQKRKHQAEVDEQRTLLDSAEGNAERIRAEVATSLMTQAADDGVAFLVARERMWDASNTRPSPILRRSADRRRTQAVREYDDQEAAVRRRWGSTPVTPRAVQAWAETAVGRLVEDDSRMLDAQRHVAQVKEESQDLHARQGSDRDALRIGICARTRISGSVTTHAVEWAKRAEQARSLLAQIDALPIDQVATLIREQAEAQVAADHAAVDRAARGRASGYESLHQVQHRQELDHGIVR
ncbi:MobF family relaxase [Marisediminicola sp. UYEF4]|uniref:MobF family relaxase n=1 Tax=Marisediminicola sp. UYEF4 TaxID=1756384 RepID=UPI0033909BE4